MFSHMNLSKGSIALSNPKNNLYPLWILASLAVLIFLAEIFAMVLLYFLQISSYFTNTLLDGTIMLVLIFPALYFLQLRPLLNQMEERAKVMQALQTSEAHLKRVMEALPVGVWIIDKDGNIIHGNPASQEIWAGVRYVGVNGYAEYKGWWADTGKRIESNEWAAVKAITRGETSLNEEINIEAFDDTQKIILNSAVPILDEKNDVIGAVVVNQDITKRRQIEKELLHQNELLEKFINNIHVLVAYLDKDFYFIRVNEAYAKAAGHPIDYFTGKNHFDLYPHDENQAIFQRVVETGEAFIVHEKPFEYAEYPERGVTYWDWSLLPVKGAADRVEGLVFSLLDVTQRKRGEFQLAQQNQELIELSIAEREQRELAESLVQATIALSSSLQLEEVLDAILEQIHRAIPFKVADIALLEDRMVRVVGHHAIDSRPEIVEAMKRSYTLDSIPLWLKAYTTKEPIFIPDTKDSPDWQVVPGIEWVRSYAGAPLVAAGEVIGFINLTSEEPGYFDEATSARLTAFAVPAALAIQNARLYMDESAARQLAETLCTSAQALSKTLDLEAVINTLLDHIQMIVKSDTAGVTLLEDETHLSLHAVKGYGQWADSTQMPSFPIDGITDSPIRRMISARKSLKIPKMRSASPKEGQPSSVSDWNWLIVPIIASDNVIGLVELGRFEDQNFYPEQIQFAEALVGQAAVAIQNAWLFQQVRSSSERLQSLARKLVEIQENERANIARELHDEAGQALSVLKLNLGRLEQDPDCPQHVRQKLDELKGVVDGVLAELHHLAVDLRPIALDHLGLVVALEQHAKNLSSHQLSIQFKSLGFEGKNLPKDIGTTLYRIAQEALSNVIRHAQASNVGILLEWGDEGVKLFIEDDGIGFNPELPENLHSMGLLGMHERAEMFGGSLTIESYPGKGTSIIVEVSDVNSHPYYG